MLISMTAATCNIVSNPLREWLKFNNRRDDKKSEFQVWKCVFTPQSNKMLKKIDRRVKDSFAYFRAISSGACFITPCRGRPAQNCTCNFVMNCNKNRPCTELQSIKSHYNLLLHLRNDNRAMQRTMNDYLIILIQFIYRETDMFLFTKPFISVIYLQLRISLIRQQAKQNEDSAVEVRKIDQAVVNFKILCDYVIKDITRKRDQCVYEPTGCRGYVVVLNR